MPDERAAVSYTTPGIFRKLAVILYDSLLLIGVLFVASLLFDWLTGYRGGGRLRPGFQLYCLAVIAGYFIWFWHRHGQTLAMRAWHVRLTTASGAQLALSQAAARFVLALFGWGLVGVTLWWSCFDSERQFLHDRLCGTRLHHEKI